MTDFRALCAELLQLELEQAAEYTDWKRRYNAAMARTRTALSQPEPVAPTDEEIEEWADAGAFASDTRACILELRARVETLERRCEVQLMQLSDLQDRHHRLTLQVGHLEHDLARDEDDLPQQHCLEAMDPPEFDQLTSEEN
jgi:chromosome segregation ATPase